MGLNPRDQSKWDALQDEGGASIDNILKGKGTDKDFKELSRILNEQHKLAGEIFDSGLTDAETTAATIVDKLNKERIESGKRPLTQKAFERVFNTTLSNVMSQALEDILGTIHDEFAEQDEAIKKKLDRAFERIRQFAAPEPQMQPALPTVPAGQAEPQPRPSLWDRFSRNNGGPAEQSTQPQRRSLMDRLLRRSTGEERVRTSVLQMIKDAATTAKDKVTSIYDRFRNRGDDDEEKKAGVWMRKLKMIFDPIRNAWSKTKRGASKIGSLLSMIGKPLLLALMNPQLIKSITDSVSKYLNFDSISKFISETWESTKRLGSDSIDWIVDKVKSFFGWGSEKKKPADKPGPKVDPLKSRPQTGALPASITPAAAAADLPRRKQQLAAAQQELSRAQTAFNASPTTANKQALAAAQSSVNLLQMKVQQFAARAGEVKTAGSSMDSATAFVSPGQPSQGQNIAADAGVNAPKTSTVLTGADPSTVMQNSSVGKSTLAPVSTPSGNTQVVADMPKLAPGKAVDANPGKGDVEVSDMKTGGATSQIGMGSFGFDSNDSALNILNLGMLA